MSEAVIHRVLGAVRFLDAATRAPIAARLRLTADEPVVWRRNASGAYVIWRAEGLFGHTGHGAGVTDADLEALFQAAPIAPAAGSVRFQVTVEDPSGDLMSRRFELRLPRAATAAAGATPELFAPVEVLMYRATSARPARFGAALYAFVHDGRGQAGRLPGAVVTVSVNGREVGRALTGPTGEALVEAVTLPSFVTSSGGGALMTTEIQADVRAAVLPALLQSDAGAWRLVTPPDPDSAAFSGAEARSGASTATLNVGQHTNISVAIPL